MRKHVIFIILLTNLFFASFAQKPTFTKVEDLPPKVREINCIVVENNKTVWIGTNQGLLKFSDEGREYFYDESNPKKFTVNRIAIDHNGTKWLGTYISSIIKFTGSVDDPEYSFMKHTNDEMQLITSLATDSNQVWCATSEGLIINYDPIKDSSQLIEGPSETQIYSLYIDDKNTKWICTTNGLFYNNRRDKWKQVNDFSRAYGIYAYANDYWAIGRDKDKRAILLNYGSYDFLVLGIEMSKKDWTELVIDGIPNTYIKFNDLDFDNFGNLWIATDDGIIRYNPKFNRTEQFNNQIYPEFKMKTVKTIAVQDDIIWVGSIGSTLYKIDLHWHDSHQ